MRKIGLALGGGGARGLAHLGVLRVLEHGRIPVSCIAGTSMGAIVGACYALNPSVATVEKSIRTALKHSAFASMKINLLSRNEEVLKNHKLSFLERARHFAKSGYLAYISTTKPAFVELEKLEQLIAVLLPDISIRDTTIPFCCVAANLTDGTEKVFTRGSLRRAVLASSSIPGVFPPVQIDGRYFNDGAAVNVTPVRAAKGMGADIVVASNVKGAISRWYKPESASEVVARSYYITGIFLNRLQLKEADVVIIPAIGHMHWTDFAKMDFMIARGEKAAHHKLLELRLKAGTKGLAARLKETLTTWLTTPWKIGDGVR